MKKFIVFALTLALFGCGEFQTQQLTVTGPPGAPGNDGISMGIDVSSTAPSCVAGGSTLRTFVDTNRDGELQAGEPIKKTTVICNGINGTNGTNGTSVSIATATTAQCPTGGVVLTTGSTTQKICNGATGAMGPQGATGATGAQGPQGVPGVAGAQGPKGATGAVGATGPAGPAGASGSVGNMTPVQLCPGDSGAYKEYGFIVGGQLYAVYYQPSQGISFLAQLSPGNYVTTNGANCQFTYSNNGSSIELTSSGGTTSVPIDNGTGLACQVYDSRSVDRSSGMNVILTNATPKFSLIINQLDVPDSQASNGFPKFTAAQQALVGTEDYALDCSGYINVPKTQTYALTMLSDDGSQTYIDNQLLISMDQLQSPTSKSQSVFLTKGLHKLNVTYFQGPLSQIALQLNWSAPEFSSVIVPNSALSH